MIIIQPRSFQQEIFRQRNHKFSSLSDPFLIKESIFQLWFLPLISFCLFSLDDATSSTILTVIGFTSPDAICPIGFPLNITKVTQVLILLPSNHFSSSSFLLTLPNKNLNIILSCQYFEETLNSISVLPLASSLHPGCPSLP